MFFFAFLLDKWLLNTEKFPLFGYGHVYNTLTKNPQGRIFRVNL